MRGTRKVPAIAAMLGVFAVYGQQAPAPAKLSFDVASVKERPANGPPSDAVGVAVTPGRLTANCASVFTLLFYAYRLTRAIKVSGGPEWMRAACGMGIGGTYIIDARIDPATTDAQAREMMQTLLAERFKLTAHWESKDGRVYALVIAPGGAKIKPGAPRDDSKPRPRIGCPVDDPNCHMTAGGPGSIAGLANLLSISTGRPVIDKTGLIGDYETDLKWAGDDSTSSSLPSLAAALRENFGFELRSETGTIQTFVVDHVEKPEPN